MGLPGVGGPRQHGWLSAGGPCLGTEHTWAHTGTHTHTCTQPGESIRAAKRKDNGRQSKKGSTVDGE